MLRSMKELIGYSLAAKDGHLGHAKDFLFDEKHWTIRWLVADTGNWLVSRKVLVSPISLGSPDWESKMFPVNMTKKEIEEAPALDYDAPVSREYEKQWFEELAWPPYWSYPGFVWGGAAHPAGLLNNPLPENDNNSKKEFHPEAGSDVVRSTNEVKGYKIKATDGEIGHVEDYILDDTPWTIRYIVVDTRNWLPGKSVLISPAWISDIDWVEQNVFVDMNKSTVKGSPEFDPAMPVNRKYEQHLYDYHGRPVYWQK